MTVTETLREFIRSSAELDQHWITRFSANLANVHTQHSSPHEAILRYRDKDGRPVVITMVDYGIEGEFLNVLVPESSIYLLCSAYKELRSVFLWPRAAGAENVADRFDRMLRNHGAPMFLDIGMPWTSADLRIIRAKLGIYSAEYVTYERIGWECHDTLEEATLDMLKRSDDPGVFHARPHMVGEFVVT